MQTLNVASGGTLYQDIPQDIYHLEYVEDVLDQEANSLHKNYGYNTYPLSHISRVNFHRIQFVGDSFLPTLLEK